LTLLLQQGKQKKKKKRKAAFGSRLYAGSGNFSAEDVVSDAEESAQIAKLEGKALRNSCYAMLKRSTGEVFLVD
jgi:hypothetical protein